MTQLLVEEAAFATLDVQAALEASGAADERREGERLQRRHAELSAMRDRLRGEAG